MIGVFKNMLVYIIYKVCCMVYKYIDYFDCRMFTINYPVYSKYTDSGTLGNLCYGNYFILQKVFNIEPLNNCLIEHGLYFGEYIIEDEVKNINIRTIYTFGEYRESVLLKANLFNVNIVKVGPYIKYVNNFKSTNALRRVKSKLGRTLLVFPSHSSPETDLNYSEQLFLDKINKMSTDYDSVLICMYWLDLRKNKHKIYEQSGFKIVCCGCRNDRYFLSRLKDLIDFSDMTVSNNLGTHLGYCIALNKPHYLFRQPISENPSTEESQVQDRLMQKEREVFYHLFSSTEEVITDEQRNLVKYYWGE